MILDNNNSDEHELYVKAIKSLNKHNTVSDHVKKPETPEEVQFMKETNRATSTSTFGSMCSEADYIRIFGNNAGEFIN